MAFKYAFNTWVYGSFPVWVPAYTLDETIRRLARIGYDGIEIGCAAPHAWPAHLDAGRRQALRELMKSEGLPCVSLLPAPGGGPGNNPASPLPEERTATIAHYKEVVDLAHDLGAEKVLYIAGWRIFGTEQAQALQSNPQVNLSFAHLGSWLSVAGRVEFVDDRAKVDELWGDDVAAWYDGGKDDPDLGLVRVVSESAQFWGQPGGKASALASIVKARVSGERPKGQSATTEL